MRLWERELLFLRLLQVRTHSVLENIGHGSVFFGGAFVDGLLLEVLVPPPVRVSEFVACTMRIWLSFALAPAVILPRIALPRSLPAPSERCPKRQELRLASSYKLVESELPAQDMCTIYTIRSL